MKFSSKALTPSIANDPVHNGVAPPLYRSSTYDFKSSQHIHEAFAGERNSYVYSRISNPTVGRLESRLAELSNSIGAVAFSSGMGAISTVFLALTKSGSNIVCSQSLFVSTFSLFKKSLSKYGVEVRYFKIGQEANTSQFIDDNTVALFTEVIGNPSTNFANLAQLGEICELHNIPLIADSTTLPPNLINLTEFNVSLIIHSLTKYISGQGRLIGGILIDTGKFNWTKFPPYGAEELVNKFRRLTFLALIRKQYLTDFGACLSPEVAELTLMGLETLDLRSERASQNSQKLAESLEKLDEVKSVNYPGLPSSPYHQIAKKHCPRQLYGALISFDVGSQEHAYKIIDSLKITQIMTNFGDVRTLVVHPYSTIFLSLEKNERLQAGASEGLIRISVGIEDIDDLIADFTQAIKYI